MMNARFTNRIPGRIILAAAFSGVLALPLAAAAQERPSPQKLFEAGQYDAAIQRVAEERDQDQQSLESTFIAALAQGRLEQSDRAREEYERLAGQDNPSWKMIGRSGSALARGDADQALAAATEAVRLEDDLGFAHFQLGLVHVRRNGHAAAAASFARAAELMPAFAYAHYYAGLSFQRVKNINKVAVHFESFLALAPDAPERLAVIAIMRSIRR
jgi:tetratricopeptide (TPR) repeat protein